MENIKVPLSVYKSGEKDKYVELKVEYTTLLKQYKVIRESYTVTLSKIKDMIQYNIQQQSASPEKIQKLVNLSQSLHDDACDRQRNEERRQKIAEELNVLENKKGYSLLGLF